jgi:hypothetical protein
MFETVEDYSRQMYDTGKAQPNWLRWAILLTVILGGFVNVYILLSY